MSTTGAAVYPLEAIHPCIYRNAWIKWRLQWLRAMQSFQWMLSGRTGENKVQTCFELFAWTVLTLCLIRFALFMWGMVRSSLELGLPSSNIALAIGIPLTCMSLDNPHMIEVLLESLVWFQPGNHSTFISRHLNNLIMCDYLHIPLPHDFLSWASSSVLENGAWLQPSVIVHGLLSTKSSSSSSSSTSYLCILIPVQRCVLVPRGMVQEG